MSQAAVPTFSIGEAIGWAWKLTWRNFWRFLLVAVVFFFLNAAISAVVSIPTNVTQGIADTSGASDAQSIALGAGALLFGLISGVVQFVVTSFLTFATIRIALSVTRGRMSNSRRRSSSGASAGTCCVHSSWASWLPWAS